MPPSTLLGVLRWKPVAINWSTVGFGQQVAGDLLDDELVEGLVAVERLHDPVAIFPDGARLIEGVAVGIGVARQVEPVPAPALAVVRRGEQPIDHFLVGVRRVVRDGNAAISRGEGGKPVRSRLTRRSSVSPVGLGRGRMPSFSSFARMKRSIGLRVHAAAFTSGGGTLWAVETTSDRRPSSLGPAPLGPSHPLSIQARMVAICSLDRRRPGGIFRSPFCSMACTSRLSAGVPGLTAGPRLPPWRRSSRCPSRGRCCDYARRGTARSSVRSSVTASFGVCAAKTQANSTKTAIPARHIQTFRALYYNQ